MLIIDFFRVKMGSNISAWWKNQMPNLRNQQEDEKEQQRE